MKRWAVLLLLLAGCAHRSRARDPQAWSELQTEHFVVRTDLPPDEAREVARGLEQVRSALLDAAWHSARPSPARVQAVVVADDSELEEFAKGGIKGFVTSDAFGSRILVMSAEQHPEQQEVLKHELAHVITNEFLLRSPRWVAEGLACYLETLRIKDGHATVGQISVDRREYLLRHPISDWTQVLGMGAEMMTLPPEQGFAFESAAWLLVHYLANTRKAAFDEYLQKLARAEEPQKAFVAAFGRASEKELGLALRAYLETTRYLTTTVPSPAWKGAPELRALPAAEVHALRAELLKLGIGYADRAPRESMAAAEVLLALQADPANPLALRLSDAKGAAVASASKAHPDDWRAWLLLADESPHDRTAIDKAAALAPDNARVLSRLAWAELADRREKKALEIARRAAALEPSQVAVLDTLGALLASSGRCAEAVAVERRALEVLPESAGPEAVTSLQARLGEFQARCRPASARQSAMEAAPVQSNETPPVKKRCSGEGPLIDAGLAVRGTVSAEYLVGEDGKVHDVSVRGGGSVPAQKIVKGWLLTCSYQPATRDGKAIAARLTQDFTFTRAPGPR